MMNSVIFYDEFSSIDSYKDLGLLLLPRKIPKPTPKTNYVDIPGGDGSLDLSEVVAGEVKYNDYVIPFEFHVIDEDLDWDSKVSEIANLLNGKKKNIIISSDLNYYYVGVRCEVSEFTSNKRLGNITINCLVKPYKLKRNITINSYEIDTEVKVEGEDITLIDRNNMPLTKFFVRGKSEQEGTPTPDNPSEIKNVEGNIEIKIEGSDTQTILFPLAEGQKLMKGSYLAEDGIHNVRKQVVFDGTENWLYKDQDKIKYFYIMASVSDYKKNSTNLLSTHYIGGNAFGEVGNYLIGTGNAYSFCVRNTDITTLEGFKSDLATKYQNGTPVIVEYELAEEERVPYTEEQQEAWNNIKELTSYKDVTHIYSTNEVSPYFDITYQKTTETIEITNDRMSVIPKITCEKDSIITFKDNSYSLSAGTHQIPDIQFKEGINIVKLNGTGTVTFEFQEGSL